MNSLRVQSLINYYIRKGWNQHLQNLCEEFNEVKDNDSFMLFWKVYAISMEGNYPLAIREYENLRKKKEIEYPVVVALLYTHRRCQMVDEEEVDKLEKSLPLIEENASKQSLLMCATLYYHMHLPQEASKVLDRIGAERLSADNPVQCQAYVLRGWIDLMDNSNHDKEDCLQYFEYARAMDDPELLLGLAYYYDFKKLYKKSLSCIDELIGKFMWYQPALSEKALFFFKLGDWDSCNETAHRALTKNPLDIEALRLMILYYLSHEGNIEKAKDCITSLLSAVKEKEKKNHRLHYEIGITNARLADGNKDVLVANLGFIDEAIRVSPGNSVYLCERGYQLRLMENYVTSMESYREALKIESTNETAFQGLVYCQLRLGKFKEAYDQMEFLSVIKSEDHMDVEMTFLQALFAKHKQEEPEIRIELLKKAMQMHMDQVQNKVTFETSTYALMTILNPAFMVEIAMELMYQNEDLAGSEVSNASVTAFMKGMSIIEKLVAKSPGFLRAQMLLANAKFQQKDIEAVLKIVTTVTQKDPSNAKAHVLQAQALVEKGYYQAAHTALQEALSREFSISKDLSYIVTKAKVLMNANELKQAADILQEAVKAVDDRQSKSNFSLYEKASVYVEAAKIYTELGQTSEAAEIIQKALKTFRGTAQESRILMANSELAVKRNDYEMAISILNSFKEDSIAYSRAQTMKADIYLNHRKDKRLFIRCYEDLLKNDPTSENYMKLANAYIKIRDIDEAVTALQKASELSPNDVTLHCRLGRLLIRKHAYFVAVERFTIARKLAPERISVAFELSDLLVKLGKFENALKVIQQFTTKDLPDHLKERQYYIQLLLLSADIYENLSRPEKSLDSLLQAYTAQDTILTQVGNDDPVVIKAQRKIYANICYKVAEAHEKIKSDFETAIEYYQKALKADETYTIAMGALATIYFTQKKYKECEEMCTTLLRLRPTDPNATGMLADIMLEKQDKESALLQFRTILETKPDNLLALMKLIILLRRAGHVLDAERYLRAAGKTSLRMEHSSGLHYCKGLYYRYRNNLHQAIEEFNLARRDSQWGKEATIHMIELYLNPDHENIWQNPSETLSKEQTENLRIARTLLDELKKKEPEKKIQVLEGYALLAEKSKTAIEKGITLFLTMIEANDHDYVPALLGLSIGYMLSNQSAKARNQLKRISKMEYQSTMSEEFEYSYILLADIYHERGKYDMAQDLCKRALKYNQSNSKAWELLGLIYEKEQSYVNASDCYAEAWKYENQASATIGYKLAFNYLKAKKHVEAIAICNHVLDLYPDYPSIKKEIIEKAQLGLRP